MRKQLSEKSDNHDPGAKLSSSKLKKKIRQTYKSGYIIGLKK